MFLQGHGQKTHGSQTPHSLVYPRKLDVALRTTTVESFMRRYNTGVGLTFSDRAFIRALQLRTNEFSTAMYEKNSHLLPHILNDIYDTLIYTSKPDIWIHQAFSDALTLVEIQLNYMFDKSTLPVFDRAREDFKGWSLNLRHLPPLLVNLSTSIKIFQSLVDTLPMNICEDRAMTEDERIEWSAKRSYWTCAELRLSIVWGNDVCMIKYKETRHLLPRSYLLLIYNKICDIFSVLVLSVCVSGSIYEPDALAKTWRFIRDLTSLAMRLGDRFFDVMKVLEGLVTGITLKELDGDDNSEFLTSILADLSDKTYTSATLESFYWLLLESSVAMRHELGCLSKILGHPYVDMYKGSLQLHERTTETTPIDVTVVEDCVRNCKRNFIKNYISRHRKWPPVLLQPYAPAVIMHAIRDGVDPDAARYRSRFDALQLAQYDYIDLGSCLEFDYLNNFIPYLKDRTLSVCKSKVLSHYLAPREGKRVTWQETRLLLWYMLSPKALVDHVNYIYQYEDCDDLESLQDYLVIRIVPKEKELKEAYRGFGCKTYYDRARCLVQEFNAMHYLDLYSDEQAMTLSELEITQKLLAYRKIHNAYPGYKPIYIVIDASGWNNRFRDESVRGLMVETLDRLFGTRLFCKTMEAYENSLLYVPDPEMCYFWDGQLGGIEGLNQDTWVITYIEQVRTALTNVGFPFHLFCKGDDMRVVLLVPPQHLMRETLGAIRTRVVEQVFSTIKKVGHVINKTESYGSANYFAFSKSASCRNLELPQLYRKIQKCYGANNAFLPFLDDYIASSFSNAHSACRVGTSYIGPYVVAVVWSYYYLHNSQWYNNISDSARVALLLVPSLLGGFPIIYLHNMFVRAESDLLSPYIGLLQYTSEWYPEVAEHMIRFTQVNIISPRRAFVGLLSDPYSLPIQKPTTPSTVMRKMIRPFLKAKIINEDLRQLFDLAESGINQQIEDSLFSATVYNSRIFSALYAATPDGLINELTRKFETGRSVMEVLILRWGKIGALKRLQRVINSETKLQSHRSSVCRGLLQASNGILPADWREMCPSKVAQTIRDNTWQRKIESVSMPPMQHQIFFTDLHQSFQDEYAVKNHFTYYLYPPVDTVDETCLPTFSSAGKRPFIGNRTRSGLVEPSVHFIEKDVVLVKVQTLIDLISWVRVTTTDGLGVVVASNLEQLIRFILTLYIPLEPTVLTPFSGAKKCGTVQHHVRSPHYRESIMPNMLSNIYQNIIGESNTHQALRGSGMHYSINFLHIYCHATTLLQVSQQFSLRQLMSPEVYWVVTSNCDHCRTPIVESPIVVDLSYLVKSIPFSLTSCQVGANAFAIVTESIAVSEKQIQMNREDDSNIEDVYLIYGCIQEFINSTYEARVRMSDKFTGHSLTPEAYDIFSDLGLKSISRSIGENELRRIPIKYILRHLIIRIPEYVYTRYPSASVDNLNTYLYSIPASEHPWFATLYHVYNAGKLGTLIRTLEQDTGIQPPSCYDSPLTATNYVGFCCYYLAMYRPQRRVIYTYLSYYVAQEVAHRLNPLFRALRHKLCLERLYPLYNLTMSTKPRDLEATKLVASLVAYLWMIPDINEEEINDTFAEAKLNSIHSFNVMSFDNINDDIIGNWASSRDEWHPHFLTFTEKNRKFHWQRVFSFMEDYYDECKQWLDNIASLYSITICYTDLSTCIQRVRTLPPEETFTTEVPRTYEDSNDMKRPWFQPRSRGVGYRTAARGSNILPTRPVAYISRQDKIIIGAYHYHRSFAFGVSSMNKLLECLSSFGLNTLPDGRNYACLGDGHGGFTACISSLTNYSHLVYNTLTSVSHVEMFPYAATTVSEQNHNTLICPDMLAGIGDLVHYETLSRLESHGLSYNVITCDAETQDLRPDSRVQLLRNVVVFYLRTRSRNGYLILKLYMHERQMNQLLLGFIRPYVMVWYLLKPKCSGFNNEIYLILAGTKTKFTGDYYLDLSANGYMDVASIDRYDNHIDSILHALNRHLILKNRSYTLDRSELETIPTSSLFELNFCHNANKYLGVMVTQEEVMSTCFRLGSYALIEDIKNRCVLQLDILQKEINGKTRVRTIKMTWNPETHKHAMVMVERWLVIRGFLALVERYNHVKISFDESFIRKEYSIQVQLLPGSLNVSPVLSSHMKTTSIINDINWCPYLYYIQGVRIAMSFVGLTHRLEMMRGGR